ncbi:hypothetical protein LR48_Vigan07g115300 [Vigna angularis]|uniref:Uncharacterized protein n=1 Tax=Phaseolus angularis TaxID=3914 RepID=A0A0L9UY46_PHAAN|nr:hypothetical protein LR48_Vigan07g115300 [Vigna angularis]
MVVRRWFVGGDLWVETFVGLQEDRGDMLKLISHGKKVNKLGPCAEGIQHIVLNSTLMPLIEICYDYVDKGLLLGFIER